MQSNVRRIILDTNLWISYLITKDYTSLDEIIFSKKYILVFSQELLDEFMEVAKRPKFRRFFSSTDIEDLLTTISEYADFVNVQSKIQICRDPKDNFLLSLAIDGNVDYLITGDKDLLDLNKFGKTIIISISEFLLIPH
jgi:putative PIN family toxin of toxin-antitoxin system